MPALVSLSTVYSSVKGTFGRHPESCSCGNSLMDVVAQLLRSTKNSRG